MSSAPDDTAGKLVMAAVIAVVVGGVSALSGVSLIFVLASVVAALVAFWLLDRMLASSIPGVAAPAAAGVLPLTSQQPLSAPPAVVPAQASAPSPTGEEPNERTGATLDPALLVTGSVEIKTNAMGKSRMFSVRIAKHGNTIEECEDAVSVDPRRAVLAVADGASSSFGSHVWATALTKQFVASPPKPLSVAAFAEWLGSARAKLEELVGATAESADANGWWSEQGARQGAFSTLVGAAVMTDGERRVATVMCLGDSSAFVLTGAPGSRSLRRALPYEDASQFGSHPTLIGSMVDRQHDEPTWTTVPIDVGDLLVLASDAVGEWLLGDPRRFAILDEHEPDAVASRLVNERTDGRIVNDDLTVAVLELSP